MSLLTWNIFEVSSETQKLHGVNFRGRLRKAAVEAGIDLLVENNQDKIRLRYFPRKGVVRFALLPEEWPLENYSKVTDIIDDLVGKEDIRIDCVAEGVTNPVLSKLACNDEDNY